MLHAPIANRRFVKIWLLIAFDKKNWNILDSDNKKLASCGFRQKIGLSLLSSKKLNILDSDNEKF